MEFFAGERMIEVIVWSFAWGLGAGVLVTAIVVKRKLEARG